MTIFLSTDSASESENKLNAFGDGINASILSLVRWNDDEWLEKQRLWPIQVPIINKVWSKYLLSKTILV